MTTLATTKNMSGNSIINYQFSKSKLMSLLNNDTRKYYEILGGCNSSTDGDTVTIPAKSGGQLVANGKRHGITVGVGKTVNLTDMPQTPKPVARLVVRDEQEGGILLSQAEINWMRNNPLK